MSCMFLPTPVVFQALAMFIVMIVFSAVSVSKARYTGGLIAVTALAYLGIYFVAVRPEEQEYERLRKDFPMENMALRVRPPASSVAALASPSFASQMEAETLEAGTLVRERMLVNLHENSTSLFISNAGFGATRMIFRPRRSTIELETEEPRPQPGPREGSAGGGAVEEKIATKSLLDLHRDSFRDFVNPKGWGFIKDRKHVAGFVPHRMSTSPRGADDWSLQTLDLVGLLMHDKPVAYVSENLPRMDQLKTAPTRDLDPFEAAGIAALRGGEDLYARQNATTLRMLGAIRAVEQCTTCHACDRGELLGAFSYTLGRVAGK
ncbi:MAG: hypothetical protein K1X57_13905 [Gemmataceae bacterium]|nr:hypothetical protein [Gemmataceae bacterium]